jgi:hypothetical protein
MDERPKKKQYLNTPEAKRERFRKRASIYTEKVLKRMDLLFQVTNRTSHDWTDQEAAAVVGAIRERLDLLEKAFEKKDIPDRKAFSLRK